MAVNADLARIYGSDDDSISLAPLGATLPTTIDEALDPAFVDMGWLHSDGITETLTGSRTKIRGHQGNAVVRSRMTESGTEIAFVALETAAQTLGLRYFEKSVDTTTPGVRKATRSPGQRTVFRAAVIDLYDSDDTTQHERFVIPRFEVVSNGDRTYSYSDISGFSFLGEIIGDYFHYSNDEEAA